MEDPIMNLRLFTCESIVEKIIDYAEKKGCNNESNAETGYVTPVVKGLRGRRILVLPMNVEIVPSVKDEETNKAILLEKINNNDVALGTIPEETINKIACAIEDIDNIESSGYYNNKHEAVTINLLKDISGHEKIDVRNQSVCDFLITEKEAERILMTWKGSRMFKRLDL